MHPESYYESAFAYGDEAGLLRQEPVRHATFLGLRYWNSDDKRTPPPLTQSPSRFSGEAMLHGTSNRLFFIPEISNTELTTVSGFCPESLERVSDARRKKEP